MTTEIRLILMNAQILAYLTQLSSPQGSINLAQEIHNFVKPFQMIKSLLVQGIHNNVKLSHYLLHFNALDLLSNAR